MINFTVKDARITFAVRALPRASKSALAGELDGALKVRLAAPPVDGAANEELIRFLARLLGVSCHQIEIISGATSRHKLVAVSGLSPENFLKAVSGSP